MSMDTMLAAVLVGPKQVSIQKVPIPQPGPGEVRIQLEGCGVCASNLATWVGMPWTQYPTPPGDLGHEGWGTIDALGEGVVGLQPGQRVVSLATRSYAQYDVAKATALVPLPASLKPLPFPGEAVGCAFNVFQRSQVQPGQTVAIVGIGFLGAILTRLAAKAGARVLAISRRPFSLELARQFGAQEVIPMDDHVQIIEQVKRLTGGTFCDVVIEAVGKQWPLDLSAEITRERGRLVIAGYHQDGPRQVNMQLWNWRGLDAINAHERDPAACLAGIKSAIAAVANKQIDLQPLMTHSFSLPDLGKALEAAEQRPEGFLKAWIHYE